MNPATSYNYSTQCWVTGSEANRTRANQLRTELATLKGPKGTEFLRFTGSGATLTDAIANCEAALIEVLSLTAGEGSL